MKRRQLACSMLSMLGVLALLLGACAPLTPEATPTVTEPEAEATPAPPTVTPLPSATPLPFPPPRLSQRSPAPGEELALEAPVELVFDQAMDRASVEAAFGLESGDGAADGIEGTFDWVDDRTVSFSATDSLEQGKWYSVTVGATARNVEGELLEEPVTFEFSTPGHLSVGQVVPAPDSEDVEPNTAVTVAFNRPVVPLMAISRQEELPDPLTFVPPVRGEGEWLNTSIYLFQPESGFLPATRYKARVASGLTDTTGASLDEDYTWEFSTIRPAVLEVEPGDQAKYVGPTATITVTFNQPMDHRSVEARFSLAPVGAVDPVTGVYRWTGGETPLDREALVFVPAEPLPRDTNLVARVGGGAGAKVGNMTTVGDTTWTLTTVKKPGVLSTSPRDGEGDVEPSGSVRITFASPMRREGFMDHLTVRPKATKVYTYWTESDTQVRIYFQREPATRYRVSLDAETPERYGVSLGEEAQVRFVTGDLIPYAVLNTDGRLGAYSAYTDTLVYASHRNVTRLDLSLYRLGAQEFVALNTDWQAWEEFVPTESELVRQWSRKVKGPQNESRLVRLELLGDGGEPLPPGLYYLQLAAPEAETQRAYQPSRYMFTKSRLNLALKQTRGEAMVWATDLTSGEPVASLPVALHSGTGKLGEAGSTDSDGVFTAAVAGVDNLWDPFFAVSGEPGDEDFGIAYNAWDRGISPWDFGVDSEFWGSEAVGYLYTDRPVYRPGQTVHFKGIVRADDDARYSIPTEMQALQLSISDPQGKELYKEELRLSDMGTLHDELVLDEQASLGNYHIEVQDADRDPTRSSGYPLFASTSFQVAEYKKPEYEVVVTTDRGAYLTGEEINVSAKATYYFGGPVASADVHWSVLSSEHWFQYTCPPGQTCPWYSWTDDEWGGYDEREYYGGYGRLIAEGDALTDEQGRVAFEVPADITKERGSRRFTVEVSVVDVNGQQVSNRTAATVHKGEFYIGVAPRGYLAAAGEEKEIDILAVDWDGVPASYLPLTAVLLEHRWYSVRKQADDGGFYWEWIAKDTPVLTTTVTTDGEGRAMAAFTPSQAGSYRVHASGYDAQDNEIESSAYFWVWGGEYVSWRRESSNRIELIADREEYQVGEVAEILVPSPYSGTVQALVTVERGRIMEAEVRELETNSEVLRIPITEEHVPNIFVSVIIVQGSDPAPDGLATFKMGVVKLPVSVASKELSITLTADRDMDAGEHYGPRQTATWDVRVTDAEGQPQQTELSLRLADRAVLALADEQGPTLLEEFWRRRGLGVRTSMPLVVSMERFNRELEPEAKGGGGGEGDGLIRTQFADTAFWDPVVRTDKEGKAQVSVTLPDNLTTWRMQARGITADTKVGRAEADVLSTLDLLVRPVLPRFFVVGDEAQIATIVHNNTAQPLEAEVSISLEGLALVAPDAVSPATLHSQTVNIPAEDKAKVTWQVKALPGEQAKVRMWATAGDPSADSGQGLHDGREDVLPVYHYSTPETVATAGHLAEPGMRQEMIQLPRAYDPDQGELTVQIEGSLTAATRGGLDYLEHYPYECTEQTVSRFLPNVVTWQTLQEMGFPRPDLRQKLSQMVGVGLQRLYTEQHYDGGWGWWVSEGSDPYLTAYVLQGMLEAHRAGFVVDQEVTERAAGFVRGKLPPVSQVNTHWEANRLAYQLYVLAEYGDVLDKRSAGELGLAVRLFDKRHLLSRYGQATLAMALSLLEPEEPQRIQTLISDLIGDAVVSATGTHWQEEEADLWNMNTDTRTTAIVLWALARLDPDGELLPGVVRWLMAARSEGHWETTQDTAWSLLGLVEYMRASGELEGDYSYTVHLNGEALTSGDVSKENIDESHRLQVEISRLLVDEANRLAIERHPAQAGQTGEGQLYYSASLRYFLPADHVPAQDRGIMVARQYSPVDQPDDYVDSARVGDVVQVKLTLIAPNDLHYVVVEDPLPAGFEGVDLSLKTTSVVGEQPTLRNVTAEEENEWLRRYGWGWWWFSHSEMRDEKAVLFAQYLPRGTYEYTYLMRASVPGEFKVIPTTAYQMYFPEVFGRSDGGRFTVKATD